MYVCVKLGMKKLMESVFLSARSINTGATMNAYAFQDTLRIVQEIVRKLFNAHLEKNYKIINVSISALLLMNNGAMVLVSVLMAMKKI